MMVDQTAGHWAVNWAGHSVVQMVEKMVVYSADWKVVKMAEQTADLWVDQ